ncbi:hypothetical protein HU200_061213 [Digitaria exilis]|uniref:Uncharacterized protein n=1 Tax=Digitaria exilis TaxID=1010633 RepID=A0A835A7Q5_9POAL|nr:hypothetical protein HU200_061213 [Digitaria exilis]
MGDNWDLSLQPLDVIIAARAAFGNAIFREIVIVASWSIWKHRNNIICNRESLSFNKWTMLLSRDVSNSPS